MHEKKYKDLKVGKILHSYSSEHLYTKQEEERRGEIINLMEEYRLGSYAVDLRESITRMSDSKEEEGSELTSSEMLLKDVYRRQ